MFNHHFGLVLVIMKKEKKGLLKKLSGLQRQFEEELKNSGTPQWNALKIQGLLKQITECNSQLRPHRDVSTISKPLSPIEQLQQRMQHEGLMHVEDNSSKCFICGESTRGNTMNGKPYCFKCNNKVSSKQSRKVNLTFMPLTS
jgi:hypothetical protein